MLVAAIPAAEILRAALVSRRQRETLRILIIIACLSSCRRGRMAIACTVRKVASPLSFLLWCLGLKARRHRGDNLLAADGNKGSSPQRRRGGWRSVVGKSADVRDSGYTGRDASDGEGAGSVRLASLGGQGRLSAFGKLRELQREGTCCDVTLAVGGRLFKAHKCVLAAQSFPLRVMFEGAFKEGSENVIALGDVEPSSFSLLLDFFYDRSVEITSESVEGLLDLSARYGVSLLRRHCCEFMARSANPSNACSLLAVADRYDCRKLRRDLLAYTLECFPLTCCGSGSDGFLQLPSAIVAEVLMDDRLRTGEEGEERVLWAAVSWVEAERSRQRTSDEILSHVRFGLISAKTLAEAVEAHPLVQTKVGKAFVHEAYRYQALPPESRENFATSMAARARPRSAAAFTALLNPSAAAGDGVGGGRFYLSTRGQGGSGSGERLMEGEFDDDDFPSDRSKSDEGCIDDGGTEGGGCDLAGPESESIGDGGARGGGGGRGGCGGGGGGDGARTEHSSDSTEEGCDGKRGGGDGAEGVRGEPPSKALVATASPSRRLWGSGLRMYV